MTKLLFVCTGNICRSPTAEIICQHQIKKKGLEKSFDADSAGTQAFHIGQAPDIRTQEVAKKHNLSMAHLRARQVNSDDFITFDYIIAMDESHYDTLKQIAPKNYPSKIFLLLSFLPEQKRLKLNSKNDIPDPYYGEKDGFETVFLLVEEAITALLEALLNEETAASKNRA